MKSEPSRFNNVSKSSLTGSLAFNTRAFVGGEGGGDAYLNYNSSYYYFLEVEHSTEEKMILRYIW